MTDHFEPTWESLSRYQTPNWFRDAKFGIWAHWSPQCEPEDGDWYAREMYLEGLPQYESHLAHYGHPSKEGFKDVINRWKGELWNPEKLIALYKRAGAQYFVALANHHDNFDLWDSSFQPWNSTVMGPKKNLIAGWEKAARKHGLRFGVSVHASHAWSWYEPAQGADMQGPFAGVPYDGRLTKADGEGTWWEGFDPKDLYEQRHVPVDAPLERYAVLKYWDWGNGLTPPDAAYCKKFYNRTVELIDKYKPDLVYFDDDVLPLWPASDVGLRIAAHYYNASTAWHGQNEAVINGKVLDEEQRKAMVWDIERGHSDRIEPLPWQTDTCLGDWHYRRSIYDSGGYKSAKTVIQTLADVVSKNGNLLLSVPVRGNGSLDDQEIEILEEIAGWMNANHECIFGTRPWKVSGEGPASFSSKPLEHQGFNEGTGKPFTAEDVRFTVKGDNYYVIALGHPTEALHIESLAQLDADIRSVSILATGAPAEFSLSSEGLTIKAPLSGANDIATVFKIETSGSLT